MNRQQLHSIQCLCPILGARSLGPIEDTPEEIPKVDHEWQKSNLNDRSNPMFVPGMAAHSAPKYSGPVQWCQPSTYDSESQELRGVIVRFSSCKIHSKTRCKCQGRVLLARHYELVREHKWRDSPGGVQITGRDGMMKGVSEDDHTIGRGCGMWRERGWGINIGFVQRWQRPIFQSSTPGWATSIAQGPEFPDVIRMDAACSDWGRSPFGGWAQIGSVLNVGDASRDVGGQRLKRSRRESVSTRIGAECSTGWREGDRDLSSS
ncbi:hypothetical protein ARMSODRAFT_967967 [Armillaria solidipes]|uniref:Uncharacterized protein n=1 Tax=Armillaria solidipes TaxID=1076256 RepID=A0A2H3C3G4_9AGAR|nr:hypothetical protein ARMSODRAFT_967967 [Armillaria solidipes]